MFTIIFKWFVFSSTNPERLSLTLKGLVPFVLLFVSYTKFAPMIDASTLDAVIKQIVDVVMLIGQIVAAVVTLLGFIRKIYNSTQGG